MACGVARVWRCPAASRPGRRRPTATHGGHSTGIAARRARAARARSRSPLAARLSRLPTALPCLPQRAVSPRQPHTLRPRPAPCPLPTTSGRLFLPRHPHDTSHRRPQILTSQDGRTPPAVFRRLPRQVTSPSSVLSPRSSVLRPQCDVRARRAGRAGPHPILPLPATYPHRAPPPRPQPACSSRARA